MDADGKSKVSEVDKKAIALFLEGQIRSLHSQWIGRAQAVKKAREELERLEAEEYLSRLELYATARFLNVHCGAGVPVWFKELDLPLDLPVDDSTSGDDNELFGV